MNRENFIYIWNCVKYKTDSQNQILKNYSFPIFNFSKSVVHRQNTFRKIYQTLMLILYIFKLLFNISKVISNRLIGRSQNTKTRKQNLKVNRNKLKPSCDFAIDQNKVTTNLLGSIIDATLFIRKGFTRNWRSEWGNDEVDGYIKYTCQCILYWFKEYLK